MASRPPPSSSPSSSSSDQEFYYEEEEVIEEFDEISLLSTIWEESSKDLSRMGESLASKLKLSSVHSPKPLRKIPRRKPEHTANTNSSAASSSTGAASRGVSLDSFLESNSNHSQDDRDGRPKSPSKSPSKTQQQKPRISLDSFLTTTTTTTIDSLPHRPPTMHTEQRSTSGGSTGSGLGEFLQLQSAAHHHQADDPILLQQKKEEALVKLVNLLTGEEVVVPEEDDEYTYVSYLSDGTMSLASDARSVMSTSNNEDTTLPLKSGDSTSSRPPLKRNASIGSHSMALSLDAIAEDDDSQ